MLEVIDRGVQAGVAYWYRRHWEGWSGTAMSRVYLFSSPFDRGFNQLGTKIYTQLIVHVALQSKAESTDINDLNWILSPFFHSFSAGISAAKV
jgi:hypothetical protein